MKTETRQLKDLSPAKYNPRAQLIPEDVEYQNIKRSIEAFGYVDPIIVNSDGTIIGGHQRYTVLRDLGYTEAQVVVVNLNKENEKALNIALNKITGNWDEDLLADLIAEIDLSEVDVGLTGFSAEEVEELESKIPADPDDWFQTRERDDTSKQEGNDEYNDFLDKFEVKKTTDDCYTPDSVYEAVAQWVAKEYGLDRDCFVRPFFPGGDYQAHDYAPEDIVVDNPPFSIISQIVKFYSEEGISFFLFAPALTLFSGSASDCCTALPVGASITYENGANVGTSFLTNLEPSELRFRTCPSLYAVVDRANSENLRRWKKELPHYSYPNEVVLATMCNRYSKYGIDFQVLKSESKHIRQLDSQVDSGKAMYGSGYLLSERAAAERAAAERAAAERAAAERAAAERAAAEHWALSDREKEIVRSLGLDGDNE